VHHFTLTGLAPETEYEYRVLGNSSNTTVKYSFKTAAVNATGARFLVINDQQDEEALQKWQAVSNAIVSSHMNEFDLIISVGDMAKDDTAFNNDRYYWWKVYFAKGRELFARKPLMATLGNHDTPANPNISGHAAYSSNAEDTVSFRKYFYINPDMTKPDYYSFSYGSAYFISVNSEIPVFYGQYPARDTRNVQGALSSWIQSEVNGAAQTKPWSFVYCHVPPINPSLGKEEVKYVRPYTDYFNQKIDWVLSGHVHTYQRVRPVTATNASMTFRSEYGRSSTQGVGYLVAAPSGQWPRISSAAPMKTELASYPQYQGACAYETGFTIIQINGSDFSLKTYGLGDVNNQNVAGYGDSGQKRLIDSVTYTRQSSASSASFNECFYRGTSNGWGQTAMTQIGTGLWETTVLVTPGEADPRFKFFTSQTGDKWYGDTDKDGLAHSNETLDISFPSGAGAYRITWNDTARNYTVIKQ
jgi:hypothetical protein